MTLHQSEIAIDDRSPTAAHCSAELLDLTAEGLLDLAQNRAEALEIAGSVIQPLRART